MMAAAVFCTARSDGARTERSGPERGSMLRPAHRHRAFGPERAPGRREGRPTDRPLEQAARIRVPGGGDPGLRDRTPRRVIVYDLSNIREPRCEYFDGLLWFKTAVSFGRSSSSSRSRRMPVVSSVFIR